MQEVGTPEGPKEQSSQGKPKAIKAPFGSRGGKTRRREGWAAAKRGRQDGEKAQFLLGFRFLLWGNCIQRALSRMGDKRREWQRKGSKEMLRGPDCCKWVQGSKIRSSKRHKVTRGCCLGGLSGAAEEPWKIESQKFGEGKSCPTFKKGRGEKGEQSTIQVDVNQ